jgi:Domain of unknown function (DUF4424)
MTGAYHEKNGTIMRHLLCGGAAFICAMAAITPCYANDTAAELSIGGLQFTRTPSVSMDSEELTISLERVHVRYQFTNLSAEPIKLTVAFPLPNIDLSEGENIAFPSDDPVNFVNFATKIDGIPTTFSVEQRAFVGNKDVSAVLRELQLPILPIGSHEIRVQELPESSRTKLVSEGLLMQAGSTEKGRPLYEPGWVVKTSAIREQTFPINRQVLVEHDYRPSVGGSSDTILRKGLRQSKAMAPEVERYRREYCVTDEFLSELDKVAGAGQANKAMLQERRINYVLKTGANWAGPIKNFQLSIEKGSSTHLVSFCTGNMKIVSALKFKAQDFTPDRDLKILFVGRF